MVNWFLINEEKQFNGDRIVLSTNDAGSTEYPM